MNRCGLAQWNVRLLMMCGQAVAMSGVDGGVPPCGTGSKTRTGFLKWALVGFFLHQSWTCLYFSAIRRFFWTVNSKTVLLHCEAVLSNCQLGTHFRVYKLQLVIFSITLSVYELCGLLERALSVNCNTLGAKL